MRFYVIFDLFLLMFLGHNAQAVKEKDKFCNSGWKQYKLKQNISYEFESKRNNVVVTKNRSIYELRVNVEEIALNVYENVKNSLHLKFSKPIEVNYDENFMSIYPSQSFLTLDEEDNIYIFIRTNYYSKEIIKFSANFQNVKKISLENDKLYTNMVFNSLKSCLFLSSYTYVTIFDASLQFISHKFFKFPVMDFYLKGNLFYGFDAISLHRFDLEKGESFAKVLRRDTNNFYAQLSIFVNDCVLVSLVSNDLDRSTLSFVSIEQVTLQEPQEVSRIKFDYENTALTSTGSTVYVFDPVAQNVFVFDVDSPKATKEKENKTKVEATNENLRKELCNGKHKNYKLKKSVTIEFKKTRWFDTAVLNNGSFYILRSDQAKVGSNNWNTSLQLNDNQGRLVFNKQLKIDNEFEKHRPAEVIMALDSDGLIYVYLNTYVSSERNKTRAYFLKLDQLGNIINQVTFDESEFKHLYYNKLSEDLYLANQMSLVVYNKSLKFIRDSYFHFTSSKLFPSGQYLYMYDGLGLTRFDAQKDEALWRNVKKLNSSSLVRSTTIVGDCLIASLTSDLNRKDRKIHYMEFIDTETQSLFVARIQDFKLPTSSIIKSTNDLKLNIFDPEANQLYVFDFI